MSFPLAMRGHFRVNANLCFPNLSCRHFSKSRSMKSNRNYALYEHIFQKKRKLSDTRIPSQNPTKLEHGHNVVSAWQSSGVIDMLQLKSEFTRVGFIQDVWPSALEYRSSFVQNPSQDVFICRLPHNLHSKFGKPAQNSMKEMIAEHWNKTTKTAETLQETADEKWNKDFWLESEINIPADSSTSNDEEKVLSKSVKAAIEKNFYSFLNYPTPGESHASDADSPMNENIIQNQLNWKPKVKQFQMLNDLDLEEFYSRGYLFIFNSGVIVTFGYSGIDRDWIDEYVQLFQDSKNGWPSFDGFNFPWYIKIPLATTGGFVWPSDMKIVRSDFLNFCWLFQKWDPLKLNQKISTNDVQKWTVNDVQSWLTSINLHHYCDIFESNSIDGHMLLTLNSNIEENIFEFGKKSSLKDYHRFTQEFNKLHINPGDIFTEDDILHLPNTELVTLLTIAYALAQAARLEVLRLTVNYYQKNSMVISTHLARKGKITLMRSGHWSKLVHHLEMSRDLLFDYGAQPILTEVPYFIEQRGNDVESLYDAVLSYLEFETTLDDIESQISSLKARYENDWQVNRDRSGFWLEFLIIVFFAIDTRDFWYVFYLRFCEKCRELQSTVRMRTEERKTLKTAALKEIAENK